MSRLLFETIRLENGQFFNLDFHQKRMDESRAICGFLIEKINLAQSIFSTDYPKIGLWRCRVLYARTIERVEFFEYSILKIKQIALIETPEIRYDLKWEDRSVFQKLLAAHPDFQEIIIAQNGFLTDATIANLAFQKDERWFTPTTFLLNGTRRQQLIRDKKLIEIEIKIADLKSFQRVALINAMRGLEHSFSVEIIEEVVDKRAKND